MGLYLSRLLGGVPEGAEGRNTDRPKGRTEQHDGVTETGFKINLLTGSRIIIGFGSSTNITAEIKCNANEADLISINWQKVENNVPVTLNLNTVKYSGSSLNLPTPELVINDAEQGDAGVYQLNVVSRTSTVTSEPVVVELHGDPTESISKEERNFVRFSLLCQNLGSKAVLLYFNKHVPEPTLASHLNTHRKDLNYISGNRAWKCNKEQFNTLFPVPPAVAKASDFDISLIYKLIRNTINVSPPTQGWGNTPLPGYVSEEDDIERVRYYRNKLAHNTDFKIQDGDFKRMWDQLSEAIKRLGGKKITSDVDSLKNKAMDNKTKSQVIENIKNLKQDVELLEQEIQEMKERLNNPIPPNLQRGIETTIKTWMKSDQVFYDDTRAYKAAVEKVKLCQVVTLIGGPGSGKTATARHIALEFKQKGWDVVPVCKISKVLEYAEQGKRQVFLIDDLLGVLSLDNTLWNIANIHRERIDESLHCDSKLICTSRKQIYKESMGLSFSFFQNIVDLEAKENELNRNEMKCMLENHCLARNVDVTYYTKISTKRSPFMFPLLCYYFSTNPNYQTKSSRFFDNPYECMLEHLNDLCKFNPLQYSALVLCLLCDNKFSFEQVGAECKTSVYNTCGVNLSTSDKQLRDALYQLTEVYLVENNGTFTFIHDSIYEIIGHHYGKENVGMILKYMPRDFIWNKVTVGDDILDDDLSIKVSENNYEYLAELMYNDLSKINHSDLRCHFTYGEEWKKNNPVHVLTGKSYKSLLGFKPFVDVFLAKLQGESTACLGNIFKSKSVIVEFASFRLGILSEKNKSIHSITDYFDNLFLNHTVSILLSDLTTFHKFTVRLMSWVVYYNQAYFLNAVIDYTDTVNCPLTAIIGDEEEMLRLLIVACFGGSLDIVKILLQHLGLKSINKTLQDMNPDKLPDEGHRCYTPFLAACLSDNLELVQYLVQNEADIHKCAPHGFHPLHFASSTGNINITKYLLEVIDFDLRINNRCGLHAAGIDVGTDAVQMLLTKSNKIDSLDYLGRSPLNIASKNGYSKILTILINEGAKVNLCSVFGESPLYQASKGGYTECVKCLIDNGGDVNLCDDSNGSPLLAASSFGNIECVELLIANGAVVNLCSNSNESPLYMASMEGHVECVKILIDKGADVNLCNNLNQSPLYLASRIGHIECVKILIDNGADVNICNNSNASPLYSASQNGRSECLKILIDNGAEINLCNNNNESPLYWASRNGHRDCVEMLIAYGAEVNLCSNLKESPLLSLSKYEGRRSMSPNERIECLKILIDSGADINQCNNDNESPLYWASRKGHPKYVEMLIDHGAEVNLCSNLKESPLLALSKYDSWRIHMMSPNERIECLKILIDSGADINQCNNDNESPLYWASRNGLRECVEMLIDHGARINLQSGFLLFCAVKLRGYTEILEILINKGVFSTPYRAIIK